MLPVRCPTAKKPLEIASGFCAVLHRRKQPDSGSLLSFAQFCETGLKMETAGIERAQP